jgi:hypothetical protein
VVIEYRFRGYSPPEDPLDAWLVDCHVTRADVPMGSLDGTLMAVRSELEELGFALHGAQPIQGRRAGRFDPLWREVWVQ